MGLSALEAFLLKTLHYFLYSENVNVTLKQTDKKWVITIQFLESNIHN